MCQTLIIAASESLYLKNPQGDWINVLLVLLVLLLLLILLLILLLLLFFINIFQASCYLQVKSSNFKISKVQNFKKKRQERNTIYMCTKTKYYNIHV